MSTQNEKLYDIFAGDRAGKPLWLVAVSSLSSAVAVMNRMATKQPGRYFVLDKDGRTVAKARLSA